MRGKSICPTKAKLHTLSCALCLLTFVSVTSNASTAYGTINNFDAVNDTGVECHGFEIELEDIHSSDITYTYNWNHYGAPKIIEDNIAPLRPRVRVRYESAKRPDGSWSAYTAIPSGPIAATDGHRFTNPSLNFGGEHFGLGYRANPTNVTFYWLIDDGVGNLIRGPAVAVSVPNFVYIPPDAGNPAAIQAAIRPAPAPPIKEFGPASWVKEIRTTTHNNNEIELRNLVDDDEDDPDDKNWRNDEPDEIEVEWQILQTEFKKLDGGKNGELVGAPEELADGDEIVTRRWEFYQYVGPYDPESGEVMTENVGPDGVHGTNEYAEVIVVGDYIGSQMSAFDHELPIGFIEHLPAGEVQEAYPTRTVVISAVEFTATVSGNLPPGLSLTSTNGQLSGTPLESGIYTFEIEVVAANQPVRTRKYILPIAGLGEPLPPYSIVEVAASPANAGSVTGGGFCTNETTTTVSAMPKNGFTFSSWTENGKIVSQSQFYTFTNIVNRTLSASFVPMPELKYLYSQSGLTLSWPTNFSAISVQKTPSLNTPVWNAVTNEPAIQGQNYELRIVPSNIMDYFRLTSP